MENEVAPPATEEEARQQAAISKRAVGGSMLLSTVMFVIVIALFQIPLWPVWAASVVIAELIGFFFIARMMDSARDDAIDELREKNGLTPRSNYPDVGI
jgi:cobalamin biosynthesis protein CobD/CbiB